MLLKTSIVCLIMILYMCMFYYRKPHLKIRSTIIFHGITAAAILNAVFDLITLYTVNHRDTVSEVLNLILHIIYLFTILLFVYLLYIYMKSCIPSTFKFNRRVQIVQTVPLLLSALGIIFLPITYEKGVVTDYSLGPKAYALYVSVVFYLILILYYCLRYWNVLDSGKRLAIFLAVPIYFINTVVQLIFPESLLVIMSSSLILMGLILSNENTEKYMDEKTDLFNQYSFETVLDEYDFTKKNSVIALLCFCKVTDYLDLNQDVQIFREIYKNIKQNHIQGFRVGENGVVFMANSEEKSNPILNKIKEEIAVKYGKDNIIIENKIINKEDYNDKASLMRIIIGFCRETGSRFAFIDYLTHIYNRNAFERDLAVAASSKKGYYIIADLNDLKITNDSIGHSAGDTLLQGFARILAEAAENNGKAYRQGGDEFAVLYNGNPDDFIKKLEQKKDDYNKTAGVSISYAIGYCEISKENFIDIADKRMYSQKKIIKSLKGELPR